MSISTEQSQAWEALRSANSYTRMPALLDLWPHLELEDWLRLVGNEWTCCDNISLHLDGIWDSPLWDVLAGEASGASMMTEEELQALADLPDEVMLYRGCYAANKWGLSWSMDRQVAAHFPKLHRYSQGGQPLLVKARIQKTRIAAIKLGREEYEVIAWRPRHVSTSHI